MQTIVKKILKNGLTVLVRPLSHIPKVSTQLWYNVGSKDEKSNEKGIAHLIEHMIFKGTAALSESDINMITHKLSGTCNAFTSYDYTGYLFDFPSQHWHEALPIMADCMVNCTFKQELLNSELKAVIQELKMYRDDYGCALIEQMLTTMFPGHPYQHPIIGYKRDLWSLDRQTLVDFYKRHYVPNNATLIVVGDVDPEDVFKQVEQYFGNIPANPAYKKEEFYLEQDLSSTQTVLYRDIQQSFALVAWKTPGAYAKLDYTLEALAIILGDGLDSRLYRRLVHELNLVTEVQAFTYDLFEHGILFVQFVPKNSEQIDEIKKIIQEEVSLLALIGPQEQEVQRAMKKVNVDYLNLLENNQKQAYVIGKTYLATGDEQYLVNYLHIDKASLTRAIQGIAQIYLKSSCMQSGIVLPIQESERDAWVRVQEESDALDARVLAKKSREGEVEPGVAVHAIEIQKNPDFKFPRYSLCTLKNDLEILYHQNLNVAKVDIILELKAKHFYDPEGLLGLGNFVGEMFLEGTERYPSPALLAQELDSYGIDIRIAPGYIALSLLSNDLSKGLELLNEIIQRPLFAESSIQKVRERIIAQLKNYWDTPSEFADQLIRDRIYQQHPYHKNVLGTLETINNITRNDLVYYAQNFLSPQGARLAIVGDLQGYNIPAITEKIFSSWRGLPVNNLTFPALDLTHLRDFNYQINRDQVVLSFASPSVSRLDPLYDKLLLFDQIFGGGVLGSMSSQLFQLREQYGLFYTIAGSLVVRSDEQPGMAVVKTIVSLDRLAEAEKLIEHAIDTAANKLSDNEFILAKNALANARIDNFSSNKQIANTFLYMRRFNFEPDYFDKRAAQLETIRKQEIQETVKNLLSSKNMIKIRIGRV